MRVGPADREKAVQGFVIVTLKACRREGVAGVHNCIAGVGNCNSQGLSTRRRCRGS